MLIIFIDFLFDIKKNGFHYFNILVPYPPVIHRNKTANVHHQVAYY